MSPEEWIASQPQASKAMSPEEWIASQGKQGTTIAGLQGAITRGVAPVAAGAALGAAAGAPFAGVGAIPGAIAGAGAATLVPIIGDPIVSTVNNLLGTKYTLPSDAMNDLFNRLGVPQAQTEAERIVQATAAGAAAGGGGALLGKAIQSASAGQVGKAVGGQLAAQPAAQIAGGAGAGLAGQAVQEAGGGTGAQIAASLLGGVAGAKGATPRAATKLSTQTAQDLSAAKEAGVRVLTSDVIPPRTFASKTLQKAGEHIPFAGTGPVRHEQQVERINAVRNVLHDFGADHAAEASDAVMADLARKRAGDIKKYVELKSTVINSLSDRGAVPLPNATAAIDDQVAKLRDLRLDEYKPIIEKLENWKDSLQGQNINNVETLRKQIGESFKSPDLTSVRGVGEKALSNIYGPLRNDMESFIKTTGERRDVTKWKVANKRLSDLSDELGMTSLKATLKRGDVTPEVVNNMLFSRKPSEVRQLYASLTPTGRQNARAAILAKAAETAKVATEAGDVVSPDKFANEVKRLGTSVGVFFKDADLDQVNGLSRVLAITKRASEAAANPNTGASLALPVGASALTGVFGGGMTGFLGTLGTAAGIGTAARIYESAPVRNILINMSKTKPGSQEEAALIKRLASVVTQQNQFEQTNSK